jgi:hypothetical protein
MIEVAQPPELLAKWDKTMIEGFSLGMYFKLILQTVTGDRVKP